MSNQKTISLKSEQISFRHSESVKSAVQALCIQENMDFADISRQIFNHGLKAKYGIEIRGNKVIEPPQY